MRRRRTAELGTHPAHGRAPDLEFERAAHRAGFIRIGGVDEAGRGPLAGPVVAACVVLPESLTGLDGLRDSKQVPPERRRELYLRLHELGAAIGVGMVDNQTIDRLNILQATYLAMQRAVAGLEIPPDHLLIDGNRQPPWANSATTVVAGDARCLSIAAASIIAKVTRDRIMDDYDRLYPAWGFCRHKGYGTAEHLDAIRRFGICDLHRRSFQPVAQLGLDLSD
jgi:ribonuclease HII